MNFRVLKLAIFVLCGSVWLPNSSQADIYVYRDKQGILNFTNVPTHAGFRRAVAETNGRSLMPLTSTNVSFAPPRSATTSIPI
jgi:hypothetical protein